MRGWNGQCSSCINLIVFCLYFFQSDQWTGGWSGVLAAWLVWSPVQFKHQGSFAFTNCLYIEVIRLLLFYQISHVSVWISNLNFGSPILSFDQICISVKQTIWYLPNYIDFCEPSLPLPYNILGVWCVYNLPSLCWYMDIRLCFSLMISIFCCLFLYFDKVSFYFLRLSIFIQHQLLLMLKWKEVKFDLSIIWCRFSTKSRCLLWSLMLLGLG